MKSSKLVAFRNERRLDDAELAGIIGGADHGNGICYLEGESIPWTELEPAKRPLVPLKPVASQSNSHTHQA